MTETPEPPREELDDFEEQLGKKQRLKFIVGIALGLVVVAAAVVVYLLWPKQPDPRCKESQVRAFLKNREIPGVAVYQVCNLPDPLEKALKGALSTPPYQRKLLIFRMAAENPKLIMPVCRHVHKAVSEAMKQPRDQASATFLKRCDLAGTGIGSPKQLASVPIWRILLAMAVYSALKRTDPKWAVGLARRMLAPTASPSL